MANSGRELPQQFRNWNFLRTGLVWLFLMALVLWATRAARDGSQWLGVVLVAGTAIVGACYVLSWWLADLVVFDRGVRVGHLLGTRFVSWEQVDRFEIRDPQRRTPFMLAFYWWADRARLRLRDGTTLRLRAIEPWHGFTGLTYLSISGPTDADEAVAWLNEVVAETLKHTDDVSTA